MLLGLSDQVLCGFTFLPRIAQVVDLPSTLNGRPDTTLRYAHRYEPRRPARTCVNLSAATITDQFARPDDDKRNKRQHHQHGDDKEGQAVSDMPPARSSVQP